MPLSPITWKAGREALMHLEAMGRAHLEYAFTHLFQYQLMFGMQLPKSRNHPDMMRNAQRAYQLLQLGNAKV